MDIVIKRAYEAPSKQDGTRILVDRLWPRGVKKEDLQLTLWLKEIAPSNELRKWFHHEPGKWDEFKKRYAAELKEKPNELDALMRYVGKGKVTLIYSAKDEERNNAVALKEYLEKQRVR